MILTQQIYSFQNGIFDVIRWPDVENAPICYTILRIEFPIFLDIRFMTIFIVEKW